MERTPQDYYDILHLSRPISTRHAPMSMIDRGAQFSPFAALVGYDAVIREAGRLTDSCADLDENSKELLNRKLQILDALGPGAGEISFLVFCPDERKDGGSYRTVTGLVKRIEQYRSAIVLTDGREVAVERIRAIDGLEETIHAESDL